MKAHIRKPEECHRPPKAVYVCDTELNTPCPKTQCHLNGGKCTNTKDIMYAKKPVEKVTLILEMSEKEAKEYDTSNKVKPDEQ